MNMMPSYDDGSAQHPQSLADTPQSMDAPMADQHVLRRTGHRPFAFHGVHLSMAMNFKPGTPIWYEINFFRLADGRFVVDVRSFKTSDAEDDTFWVAEANSFEDAIHALESYDASRDVAITFDLEDPSLSVADLTFRALSLRIRVEEARRQYRSLLGQVLYDLNNSDV